MSVCWPYAAVAAARFAAAACSASSEPLRKSNMLTVLLLLDLHCERGAGRDRAGIPVAADSAGADVVLHEDAVVVQLVAEIAATRDHAERIGLVRDCAVDVDKILWRRHAIDADADRHSGAGGVALH